MILEDRREDDFLRSLLVDTFSMNVRAHGNEVQSHSVDEPPVYKFRVSSVSEEVGCDRVRGDDLERLLPGSESGHGSMNLMVQ